MPQSVSLPGNPPRWYQRKAWDYFERGGKRGVLVWHRRAGKDDLALNLAAVKAHERIGNYWHCLPLLKQGKKAIWTAINPHTGLRRIDEAFPEEIRAHTADEDMRIDLKCGSTWQVIGSDRFDALVGSPPVGITFSEWALSNPMAWVYLRPILAENDGWALFISTPRGPNHFQTLYEGAQPDPTWFTEKLSAVETDVFTSAQLMTERSELIRDFGEDDGDAKFRQEYLCDFTAAVAGAYYARAMAKAEEDKRIGRVPYDPALRVTTAWDLGIGDDTAIWFAQAVGREVRIIDYYENRGMGLEHYAGILDKRGYAYNEHILPHDAEVRELGTGTSRVEVLWKLRIGNIRVLPQIAQSGRNEVDDGINAGRLLIARSWFDSEKCATGLRALRLYRRDYDDERRVFSDRPLHDWTSHAADAWRYLARGIRTDAGALKPIDYNRKGIV